MKEVSQRYRDEMKEPFKNKWLCMITIGAINNTLQTYGTIESDEQLSEISQPLNDMLTRSKNINKIATFEKNVTQADGSSFFYDSSISVGTVFDKIIQEDDTLSFTYKIDGSYADRDVEKMIIKFSQNYPRHLSITYDIVDSPFFKTEEFDNDSYQFEVDEYWENISYITVEMSNFAYTGRRVIIDELLFGDIISFSNEQLSLSSSAVYKEYKSFKSEELPYKQLTISVTNEDQKYDIEDITNDIRLLEKGQDVYIQFGYQYDDEYSTIEYVPSTKLILKDYDLDETTLTITCTDKLNNMSGNVEVDAAALPVPIDSRITASLIEGYENDIVLDSRIAEFVPQGVWIGYEGDRKQGLLMYANAYTQIIDIDNDNIIHFLLNNFVIESVSGTFASISNIDSIKDYFNTDLSYFRDYATFEKDYTKADGKKIFPVDGNTEFTGFIGKYTSDAIGNFDTPITITLNYYNYIPNAMTLLFVDGQYPKEYSYELFDYEFTSVYQSDKIVHEESDILSIDLPLISSAKSIRFTFYSMYKEMNTIHLKAVKHEYISDYVMSETQYETYYPSCENQTLMKDLAITCNIPYVGDTRGILFSSTVVFPVSNELDILLTNATFTPETIGFNKDAADSPTVTQNGVTVQLIDGKMKHVKLINDGTYEGQTIELYGEALTVEPYTKSYVFNKIGDGIEISNQLLIGLDSFLYRMSEWYAHEESLNKLYKFNYMGDPSLQLGDVIGIPTKKGEIIYIRIETNEITFSNGGLRGYIEGRKI